MALELISFVLCPFVQRAVITALEKNVQIDLKYIDLDNPPDWFKEISPFGKVPLLKVDGTVLFESAVINEYLDETYSPTLSPPQPLERALQRSWTEFASDLIMNQHRIGVAPEAAVLEEETAALEGKLKRLDNHLGDGPYFSGEAFRLVDTSFAPFFMRLDILRRAGLQIHVPAGVAHYSGALLKRKSVQKSVVKDLEERYLAFLRDKGSCLLAA